MLTTCACFVATFCTEVQYFQISIFSTFFWPERQLSEKWPRFLLHNKTPHYVKSRRVILCEVKLHLAPSLVLVIFGGPAAQHHTGSDLLMKTNLLKQAGDLFVFSQDFWVAGTYSCKHALHHALSLVNCPKQTVPFPHKC